MRRALVVIVAALAPLAVSYSAEAQQTRATARIGLICEMTCRGPDSPFMQGLRERGWREGQNLQVERREGTSAMVESFAADLVRHRVDVIVTFTTPAGRAAHRATRAIPIVMALYSGDAVADGLVVSLARPGGNVTGFTTAVPGQQEKLYELIKEAVPRLSRLANLWDLGFGPYPQTSAQTGSRPGIEILPVPVRTEEDLKSALQTLGRRDVQALLVPGHPFLIRQYRSIAEFAVSKRLPSISAWREFPEAGGLMSYWSNLNDLARRASLHVDKILKGTKRADLPVEQPTKFELVINLKTAQALGLTIPPSLLLRADHVIE
jgi:putative ABC transport system substrate-binding protein